MAMPKSLDELTTKVLLLKNGAAPVVAALFFLLPQALAGYNVEVVQGTDREISAATSLEFDNAGSPTIAYGDGAADEVRLAVKSGFTWSVDTADARYPVEIDHVIGGNGNVGICYAAAEGGGYSAFAAIRSGGSWTVERVARGSTPTA